MRPIPPQSYICQAPLLGPKGPPGPPGPRCGVRAPRCGVRAPKMGSRAKNIRVAYRKTMQNPPVNAPNGAICYKLWHQAVLGWGAQILGWPLPMGDPKAPGANPLPLGQPQSPKGNTLPWGNSPGIQPDWQSWLGMGVAWQISLQIAIGVRTKKSGFERRKQGSRFLLKKVQRGPSGVRDSLGVVAFCKFGAKSRLGFERRNQGSRISPKNKERGPREGGKGDR